MTNMYHVSTVRVIILYWRAFIILLLIHQTGSFSLSSSLNNNNFAGRKSQTQLLDDHTDLTTLREGGYDKLVDACFQNDIVGNTMLSDLRAMTYDDFVTSFSEGNPAAFKAKLIGWIAFYQLRHEFYEYDETKMENEISKLKQFVDSSATTELSRERRHHVPWKTFPFQQNSPSSRTTTNNAIETSSSTINDDLDDPLTSTSSIDTPYISAAEVADNDDTLPPSLDKDFAGIAESMREEMTTSSSVDNDNVKITILDDQESTAASTATTDIPMNTPSRKSLPSNLELRAMPGKGLGVITKEAIPANTVIGDYKGEVLTLGEKDRRYVDTHLQTTEDKAWVQSRKSRDQTITGDYLYRVIIPNSSSSDNAIYVDAEDEYKSNWARFLNHNTPPNIHPKSIHESWDGNPRVWFVSDRDIEPGEELCFDYGDDYWLPEDNVV